MNGEDFQLLDILFFSPYFSVNVSLFVTNFLTVI